MVKLQSLRFSYSGDSSTRLSRPFGLRVDELQLELGSSVALIGPSGSGKTTLVNLIAGILTPTSGSVWVGDTNMTSLTESRRRSFRLQRIGLVFQEFELLEYLSVLDNIVLPYRLCSGLSLSAEVRGRAAELANEVGLGEYLHKGPRELSQGERQRLATCRALIAQPELVLADEPTGNLDPQTKEQVLRTLVEGSKRRNTTLLMVTHDHGLLERFDRVLDCQQFRSE